MTRDAVVSVVYKTLPMYRIPFFEALRPALDARGVELRLIHGDPTGADVSRRDTGTLPWARRVPNRIIRLGSRALWWQPCVGLLRGSDLVVVEQASRLVLNYVLLARQALGGAPVAFWGHGRNFQHHGASPLGEAVKRRVSRWPAWWFAYNRLSAGIVRALPYPAEQITVVQNAVDTRGLRAVRQNLTAASLAAVQRRWGIRDGPLAVVAGGLYAEKRVMFLLEAAQIIRARVPGFQLVVIGAGPDENMVKAAAQHHSWIHYVGPQFGAAKVPFFALAQVALFPGLVGLGILDAFALEAPPIAAELEYHSPEISYLEDGVNGVLLPEGTGPAEYADGVVRLLADGERLQCLRAGCRESAARYTLEAMVGRFTEGVMAALRRTAGPPVQPLPSDRLLETRNA